MPLIGRILIVVVIAIAIVIAALFIAVWFTDFDTIGELLSFIKANVSNLPAK
jgi:ABC-type phosphate transport system permease subunit